MMGISMRPSPSPDSRSTPGGGRNKALLRLQSTTRRRRAPSLFFARNNPSTLLGLRVRPIESARRTNFP
eukprot:8701726-Pyramimonas_sp.AAC.1